MCPVEHVWAEASRDSKVFSRNLKILRQHCSDAECCSVASEDQLRCFVSRKLVAPSNRPRLPAVLMGLCYSIHETTVFFQARPGRVLEVVEIVDLPRRMILRHKETVTVDERGLNERTHRFRKSEGDKLPLHHPQEPQIGMILARKSPRNSRRHIVVSKLDLLPIT